jgi:hypothetical protein
MQNFIGSPAFFVLAITIGIVIWTIRGQNNRKDRDRLIHEIESSKAKAVYFDTKATLKVGSLGRSHFEWENAELIFTERSILYFGYRLYMHIRHWFLRGENLPHKISQSAPINDLEVRGKNLVISSILRKTQVTTTLKNVANSEQFEVIKKMLYISLEDYKEG